MEIGIQSIGSYDHLLKIAQITEANGGVAIAVADHYLYGNTHEDYNTAAYDTIVQAAALGRDTKEIDIVMLVSPVTFRHPAVYAKSAVTIDELSGGRFALGLGTGWHDDEHAYFGFDYPPLKERFEMLDEQLGYVRAYFDDPQGGYESSRWSFKGYDAQPRARAGLRLMVGGGGPVKTPTLAGKYCDEFNLYHHDPSGIAERLAVARAAAEAAGRNFDDVLISTSLPALGVDSMDEVDEVLDEYAAVRGGGEATKERLRPYVKTWKEQAETVEQLEAAGIQRVYIQMAAMLESQVKPCLKALV